MGPSGVNPPPPPRRCVSCVFGLTLPSSMSATPASGNFSMTSSTKSSSGHLFGTCSGSSWYAGYPLATTVTSDLLWVLLFKVAGLGLRMWWHTVVALTLGVPTRQPRAPLALPVIALIAVVSIVVLRISSSFSLSVRVRRCALVLSLSLSLKLLAFCSDKEKISIRWPGFHPMLIGRGEVRRNFSNNISKRRVDWGRAILEGGGGDEGAQWPRWHSQRGTRPPGWTAARSRCASGRYLCPQTVTASPRGASAGLLPWQERLGRGDGGARMVGRDPSGHQRPVGAIDKPRSARPMDTSSTSQGSLRGRGRA